MAELQTGELITPSLKLVRHLGTGGMGTVWVARHLGLNSDVVVKFITGDFARNAEAVARFQREAGAASEVRSPHVVQVFDYGIAQNGFPYIAMELLEGEDFAARIARQHLVPAAEVAGVVVQVARALARAHEKKIVHRDIKPENLFLCETGEEEAFVKVLDFGIAKFGSPGQFGGTATGAMLGTPYFMSPEQVNDSKSIDHRTDLWSLAVVAYYAMTGVRPFDGETLVAVAMKICTGEVPPPSSLNPQLPPAVDAWFARACAKDPNARFPSARALADALVSAVGGRAVAQVMSKAASFDQEATQEFRPSMLGASGPALPARLSVPQPPIHVVSAPVQPTMLATTTGASIAAAATGDHGITVVQPRRSRVVPVILGGAAAGVLIGVIVYTVSSGGSSPRPAATGAATETADETSTATTRLPSKRPAPSETSTAEPAGSASSAVPVAPTRRPPPAGSTTAVATPPTVSTAAPTLASATTKPTATTKPPATTTRSKPTYEPLE